MEEIAQNSRERCTELEGKSGNSNMQVKGIPAGHGRLMPVILDTQEAEIRSIMVQSQPKQIVHETLS
jgi:hypothetical protein